MVLIKWPPSGLSQVADCCNSCTHNMCRYFHAYRIDHILGFFRIWEIPGNCTTGLLGHFRPSYPLTRQELESHGIWDFDRYRFCAAHPHRLLHTCSIRLSLDPGTAGVLACQPLPLRLTEAAACLKACYSAAEGHATGCAALM